MRSLLDFGTDKNDRFVTIVTAACSVWNVGLAFVAGIILVYALRRKWVRL